MLVPTQTWPSRVSARTADYRTGVFMESSSGHNIDPPSQCHQDSRFLPTAIQWSVGTFARLIRSAFAFSGVNPLRDWHLRTHQISRGHTRIFARAYYLRQNNGSHVTVGRTMCHAGTRVRDPILLEPQWRLILIESPCPYYLEKSRRSRRDGRKLLIPLTSRTLSARRGEPSTNILEDQDAPLVSVQARQIPLPRNSWRTRHTRPGMASPPGSSTRSYPTYGRFQNRTVTVSLNPLGQKSWSQENLLDKIPSSESFNTTLGQLSNLNFTTSSFPACSKSKFRRSGEES